jgi:hypothetical protein
LKREQPDHPTKKPRRGSPDAVCESLSTLSQDDAGKARAGRTGAARSGAARRARLIRRRGRSRDPEHDGTFGMAPVAAGAYRPAVAVHATVGPVLARLTSPNVCLITAHVGRKGNRCAWPPAQADLSFWRCPAAGHRCKRSVTNTLLICKSRAWHAPVRGAATDRQRGALRHHPCDARIRHRPAASRPALTQWLRDTRHGETRVVVRLLPVGKRSTLSQRADPPAMPR